MEPVAAVPAPVAPGGARRQRKLRNYLLNAPMQLRFASYLIGVGVALSLGLGFMLFRAYSETSRVIALTDPDTSDGIALASSRPSWPAAPRITICTAAEYRS